MGCASSQNQSPDSAETAASSGAGGGKNQLNHGGLMYSDVENERSMIILEDKGKKKEKKL